MCDIIPFHYYFCSTFSSLSISLVIQYLNMTSLFLFANDKKKFNTTRRINYTVIWCRYPTLSTYGHLFIYFIFLSMVPFDFFLFKIIAIVRVSYYIWNISITIQITHVNDPRVLTFSFAIPKLVVIVARHFLISHQHCCI